MKKEISKIYTPPWTINPEPGKSNSQLRRERAERLKAENRLRREKKRKLRAKKNKIRRHLDSLQGRYYQGKRTRRKLFMHDFQHSFSSAFVIIGCILFGFSLFNLSGLQSVAFAESEILKWITSILSGIAHLPVQTLFAAFNISLPEWPIDLAILWLGMAGFMLRTVTRERDLFAQYEPELFGKLRICVRMNSQNGTPVSIIDVLKRGSMLQAILASLLAWPVVVRHNLDLPYITVEIWRKKRDDLNERISAKRVKKI